MKVPLQISTHDLRLGFDLAGIGNTLTSGTAVDAPGGVRLEYHGTMAWKSFGIPEVLEFVVDASVTTDLALFAAWLYDKVTKRHVEKITIRDTVVTEISEESIRETLQREVRIQR